MPVLIDDARRCRPPTHGYDAPSLEWLSADVWGESLLWRSPSSAPRVDGHVLVGSKHRNYVDQTETKSQRNLAVWWTGARICTAADGILQ